MNCNEASEDFSPAQALQAPLPERDLIRYRPSPRFKRRRSQNGATMKRTIFVGLAGMVLAGMLMPLAAQDQSGDNLGDYARNIRKDKAQKPGATKKFDNDNLPTDEKLSIVGPAPAEAGSTPAADQAPANAASTTTDATAKDPGKETAVKPGQSAEDRQKANNEWKDKIAAQKAQIDLASRELDVMQREYRLRAAAFYADAGNRLRNSASWDKEDAQYKQQIAQKQKAVEAAKQQLDGLQEQARKAGVPSSMR
jgi:hypothetical protein